MASTVYICPNCTNKLRPPSFTLQRSWCQACDMFLIPLVVDPETMEEPPEQRMDNAYRFTTFRPTGNSFKRGETPEHRFSYIKRTDTLVPKEKGKAYAARCTCKWKSDKGFTSYSRAYRLWETHMQEVDKQQTLSVGLG